MRGSSQHPRAGFRAVLHAWITRRNAGHFDAIAQEVLPPGHHGVVSLETFADIGAAIQGLADSNCPRCDGPIRPNDEDERTVLSLQHGRQWDAGGVWPFRYHELNVDKLTWP